MRPKLQQIKPIKTSGEGWRFEVLGVPFGGHLAGKDEQGEYFTENTDVMLSIGDKRPVIYYHGHLPSGEPNPDPSPIGTATVIRKDDKGWWFDVMIDKSKKFAKRLWQSAIMGLARASGGSVPHLVRKRQDGELLSWPLAELTLVDQGQGRMAANQYATVNLKSVYTEAGIEIPEGFVEETEVLEAEPEPEPVTKEDNTKEIVAAVSTVILEALSQEEENGKRNQ